MSPPGRRPPAGAAAGRDCGPGRAGRSAGRIARAAAAALALVTLPAVSPLSAQEEAPNRVRVFLDCDLEACDTDHVQREIAFVDWVRDRRDADVHVLVTVEDTGAGGERFDLDFQGRSEFAGLDETLRHTSSATDTDVEVREGVTRTLAAGLVRYVARTGAVENLRVEYRPDGDEEEPVSAEDDPWNRWVFRSSVSGSFSAEDRSDFVSLSLGQSASRVTEAMKLGIEVTGQYDESNFDVSDTETVTSVTRSFRAEALYVASLGSHWGAGLRASAEHSTFRNFDLALRLAPAVEYNVFPYEESTRRQFRVLYAVGPRRFDYQEETVFLETSETRVDQSLSVSLDVREPWGSANVAVEGSHYFDDFGTNRLFAFGFLEVRLLKGFNTFVDARATRVRDQFNLRRGEATEEEVLLRQRELQTDFRLEGSIGFSFTFGSVFTDAVNPRFGG